MIKIEKKMITYKLIELAYQIVINY